MMRDYQSSKSQPGTRRRNLAATMVAGGLLAFVYYSYEPVSAEDGQPQRVASASTIDLSVPITVASTTNINSESVPNPTGTSDLLSTEVEQGRELSNRYAILFAISQLQRGIEKISAHESYSVVFERLERINGAMQDQQQIELKMRHAPFSVYMKWKIGDKGRQLLYAENKNNGRMLVKLGGFKGRFIPTVKLEPHGALAMAETRHPITRAGIANMARELIITREKDLKMSEMPNCTITEGLKYNDRPCYQIVVDYRSAKESEVYRKTITMIDEEHSIPVFIQNYTWATENTVNVEEETLIECYSFKDIRFDEKLKEETWANGNYRVFR